MENKIKSDEISCLEGALMKFPTWSLFEKLIRKASNTDNPGCCFGEKPMGKDDKTLLSVDATEQLIEIIRNNNRYVGIDVPVLLRPKTKCNINDKTIIIVGESPLRDTEDFTDPEKVKVLLGTPYAIHQKFDCPPRCNVYKKIFSDLIGAGYSIYLTDIIKVWWDKKELKPERYDVNMFKAELDALKAIGVREPIIVSWGKTAENALVTLKKRKIIDNFFPLPHPSKRGWNNWKTLILEEALYDEEKNRYAKTIYPDKDHLNNTEVKIAKMAVDKILGFCNDKDHGKRRPYTYKGIVEIDYPEIWDLAQKCLQITKAWQEMTVELMPLFKKRSALLTYLKVRSLYSFAYYIAEQVNHLCHQLAFCANEQDQEGVDRAKIMLADLFEAFGKVDAFDIAQDNIDGFLKLEQDVEGFGERTDFHVMDCYSKEGRHSTWSFLNIAGTLKNGESSCDSLWEAVNNSPEPAEPNISGLMESGEDNKLVRMY